MPIDAKNQLDFIQILKNRGYLHQISDEEGLKAAAAKGVLTAYTGYDCTAPSLHVGNLISIMMLRVFQKAGHKPIVLVGGGTTKVGDPSGKDKSRKMLTQTGDRREQGQHQDGVHEAPELRRRRDGRDPCG